MGAVRWALIGGSGLLTCLGAVSCAGSFYTPERARPLSELNPTMVAVKEQSPLNGLLAIAGGGLLLAGASMFAGSLMVPDEDEQAIAPDALDQPAPVAPPPVQQSAPVAPPAANLPIEEPEEEEDDGDDEVGPAAVAHRRHYQPQPAPAEWAQAIASAPSASGHWVEPPQADVPPVSSVRLTGSYEERKQQLWAMISQGEHSWISMLLGDRPLVFAGENRSGKTQRSQFVALCRKLFRGDILEAWTPHGHHEDEDWRGFDELYGSHKNAREIGDRVKAYYQRQSLGGKNRDCPTTCLLDEVWFYSNVDAVDREFAQSMFCEAAKAFQFFILVLHGSGNKDFGNVAGFQEMLRKYTVRVDCRNEVDPLNPLDGLRPSGEGTVSGIQRKRSGSSSSIDVAFPEWMCGHWLREQFAELHAEPQGSDRQSAAMPQSRRNIPAPPTNSQDTQQIWEYLARESAASQADTLAEISQRRRDGLPGWFLSMPEPAQRLLWQQAQKSLTHGREFNAVASDLFPDSDRPGQNLQTLLEVFR